MAEEMEEEVMQKEADVLWGVDALKLEVLDVRKTVATQAAQRRDNNRSDRARRQPPPLPSGRRRAARQRQRPPPP